MKQFAVVTDCNYIKSSMDPRRIRLASRTALAEFLDYMLYYRHNYKAEMDENDPTVATRGHVSNLDSVTAGSILS